MGVEGAARGAPDRSRRRTPPRPRTPSAARGRRVPVPGTGRTCARRRSSMGPSIARRRTPVQLERAVHHGDVVTVLEAAEGHVEPGQAERAPRAGVVGPHIDLHAPPTLRAAHPLAYDQSCAGHSSAAAMSVQQVAAVDGLADDVGVAGVPRRLLNEVQEDPARRPDDAARYPRHEVDRGREGSPRSSNAPTTFSVFRACWSARAITSPTRLALPQAEADGPARPRGRRRWCRRWP